MEGLASCSGKDFQDLLQLVPSAVVAHICSHNDVATLGVDRALLKYLAGEGRAASQQEDPSTSLDVVFLLFSGYLVFFMQSGFAMLCAGNVRTKNSGNILLKNLLDVCVGAITYYLVGNSFAFGNGSGSNGFIGVGDWALSSTVSENQALGTSFHLFFFHFAFSAASTTIVSGAVAERIHFPVYMVYTVLMSAFVYPVISHWVWAQKGWLSATNPSPLFGSGAIDFSGSGVVHVTGGAAAIIGVILLGPRVGRFGMDGQVNNFRSSSSILYLTLGTFILWFGWFGFNPGSNIIATGSINALIIARAAVCSTLAAGAGGCSCLMFEYLWGFNRRWDLVQLCNGTICGLVAVTAGCSVMQPWAALLVGVLSGPLFLAVDKALLHLKIDDVVSAFPMHFCSGSLGVLFVGFFAEPAYVRQVYGNASTKNRFGVFLGGSGQLLACQLLELVCITAWVTVLIGGFFFGARLLQILRVPLEQELAGLDASKYSVLTSNDLPSNHNSMRGAKEYKEYRAKQQQQQQQQPAR